MTVLAVEDGSILINPPAFMLAYQQPVPLPAAGLRPSPNLCAGPHPFQSRGLLTPPEFSRAQLASKDTDALPPIGISGAPVSAVDGLFHSHNRSLSMASSKRGGDKPKSRKNGNGRGRVSHFEEDAPRLAPDAHNSVARLKAENEAIEGWCVLQDEEDSLIEKYIQPIRDKKQKLKSDLKSGYEIPTEAFNARAGLRRIERREGADEVVLALNELFQATPVGHNIDMEAVLARVEKKKAEKAAAKTKATVTEHPVA